ncbi:MAG: glycogen debranching protein GlgX [Pseudomonadota bacterium]
MTAETLPGRGWPLGVTVEAEGVNVAVFSANATKVEFCPCDPDGREAARIPLRARTGDVWHSAIPGIGPGTRYHLRAYGPWDRNAGHVFDPSIALLDPYARCLSASPHDPDLVQCVVEGATSFDWEDDRPPDTPWEETLIYEAHVRGLTMQNAEIPAAQRGTFKGLAHDAVIRHLKRLGATAIELLPVMAFTNEPFLTRLGLRNYWGYNTIGFFAPHLAYGTPDDLRAAIRAFHKAGIEVILDVVYNHTGEGDLNGRTCLFRGLDNASYYRRQPDGTYVNDTGCGNTVASEHPMVLRLILDSLRYWVDQFHVDGFRFDLATTLAREPAGYDPKGRFLSALLQDPVLSRVKLIAEPWDIGPGGYQVGGFPAPFSEWNDGCRDDIRRFWRRDRHAASSLATRILGSASVFDRPGRAPAASVNFITAHDGFTLADLVSYAERHNEANREGNRDGHAENLSSNGGIEGPSTDPAIVEARNRKRRVLMATLMVSQGVPMMLAGDELGNSQGGNNNAYCQDNPIGWVDWASEDPDFHAFVRHAIATRRRYTALSQTRWLHGRRIVDGEMDAEWFSAERTAPDWSDPDLDAISLFLAAETVGSSALFIVFNRGDRCNWSLPPGAWRRVLASEFPDGQPDQQDTEQEVAAIAAESVTLFAREDQGPWAT